jgi:hypothetical protein
MRLRLFTQTCRLEMYIDRGVWAQLPQWVFGASSCLQQLISCGHSGPRAHVKYPIDLCMPGRAQQALLAGAVQSLERHLSGLFASWNRAALAGFAARLSGPVERSLRCTEQTCEPNHCGGLLQPDVGAGAAEAADGLRRPEQSCEPSRCGGQPQPDAGAGAAEAADAAPSTWASPSGPGLDCAQPEAVTGCSVESATAVKGLREPDLAPSTPAGRDVRPALPAAAACATPAAAATAVPLPVTAQAVTGPAQQQGAQQQAAGAEAAAPEQTARSAAAVAAGDGLSAWAAAHPAGDPAAALVLASAAFTAACDMGLASGAGPVPWPQYLISTRDSFTHHLHARATQASHVLAIVRHRTSCSSCPTG